MNSELIQQFRSAIESEIDQMEYNGPAPGLYEPIKYILKIGGKRLRPILVFMAYNLFKKDWNNVINAALAVEIFHNFTLMHDDIMDNAPIRRGNQTVHIKWNENKALLSGDLMLIEAFRYLTKIEEQSLSEVLRAFIKCSAEVCEGQELDMQYEQEAHVTIAEYLNMIRLKTAALLGMSLKLGAILADQKAQTVAKLDRLGISLGIGFQLKDDYLDVYAEKEKFGKQVGGDIIANKKTYLLLSALELADKKQKELLHHWLTIKDFNPNEKVEAVKSVFDEVGVQQLTLNKMNDYFNEGIALLDELEIASAPKKELNTFINYLINREQ